MKEFLLLFRSHEADRKNNTPEETQARMNKWQQWIGGLAQSGNMLGAQPLAPEGRVLRGTSKKLTDGPFMEGKEVLGGYVLLKAGDYDEAVKISEGCPILDDENGTVEIRETTTM